jgi:hypothetical protein
LPVFSDPVNQRPDLRASWKRRAFVIEDSRDLHTLVGQLSGIPTGLWGLSTMSHLRLARSADGCWLRRQQDDCATILRCLYNSNKEATTCPSTHTYARAPCSLAARPSFGRRLWAVVDALSFLTASAAGPLADAFRLMPPTGLPGRFGGTAETQVA